MMMMMSMLELGTDRLRWARDDVVEQSRLMRSKDAGQQGDWWRARRESCIGD